jgi:hypothetical protein
VYVSAEKEEEEKTSSEVKTLVAKVGEEEGKRKKQMRVTDFFLAVNSNFVMNFRRLFNHHHFKETIFVSYR